MAGNIGVIAVRGEGMVIITLHGYRDALGESTCAWLTDEDVAKFKEDLQKGLSAIGGGPNMSNPTSRISAGVYNGSVCLPLRDVALADPNSYADIQLNQLQVITLMGDIRRAVERAKGDDQIHDHDIHPSRDPI